MDTKRKARCIGLFAAAVSLVALAGGLSGSIFSNYFREAFGVSAFERGLLETPRESGGVLCALIFMGLGALGDVTLAVAAQGLMALGLLVMGLMSPSYGEMILFLFVYSMGQHLFMPVNDSIAMSLAEEGHGGGALGLFKKYSDLFAMVAGALVFVGFKAGWFSFTAPVILPFALALLLSVAAGGLLLALKKELPQKQVRNTRLVLRREYLPYYLTTFAYGCQKRIRIVFGPWVLIELLGQGADVLALLTLASRLAGSLTAPWVGRFLDRRGLRLSLQAEAAYMALVFAAEGLLAGGLAGGALTGGLWLGVACVGLVLVNLIDQFQMVHSLLMKQLAGPRGQEVTASLSMGISVDHIMAIVVSPLLGLVWTGLGPAWVFYITAVSVVVQVLVARRMLPDALAGQGKQAP